MPEFLEIPEMSADRLTSQLYHLPAIIGRLGLSVANAQKALNADYLANIRQIMWLIMDMQRNAGGDTKVEETMKSLLRQLAPSRYQFTETTLDFRADLSESLDVAGSVGLGAGFGAVVINAGVSIGYGRDYRAAARVKTILNAIPADPALTKDLFARADNLLKNGVTLPARTEVDAATTNGLRDILGSISGKELPKVAAELPLPPLRQVEEAADRAEEYQRSAEAYHDEVVTEAAKEPPNKRKAKEAATESANSARAANEAFESAQKAAASVPAAEKEQAEKARKRAEDAKKAAKTAADDAATKADKIPD